MENNSIWICEAELLGCLIEHPRFRLKSAMSAPKQNESPVLEVLRVARMAISRFGTNSNENGKIQ